MHLFSGAWKYVFLSNLKLLLMQDQCLPLKLSSCSMCSYNNWVIKKLLKMDRILEYNNSIVEKKLFWKGYHLNDISCKLAEQICMSVGLRSLPERQEKTNLSRYKKSEISKMNRQKILWRNFACRKPSKRESFKNEN